MDPTDALSVVIKLQGIADDCAHKAFQQNNEFVQTTLDQAHQEWSNFGFNTINAKNKKSKRSHDSHLSTKLKKIMLAMSLKDTSVTQSVLCLIFLMYVRIIKRLKQSGRESKKTTCS